MTPEELAPRKDRPFVWLNCAISLDGRLAYAEGRRAPLSSREDLARVQRIRRTVDAVLVGVGTVIADDPSLRVHHELLGDAESPTSDADRSRPLRVVLDSRGRTPSTARVLDGQRPTVIFTAEGTEARFPPSVQVVPVGKDTVSLTKALRWLRDHGVGSVLVEGGSQVIASFVEAGLVDRLTVYIAPVVIGGESAPRMVGGKDRRGPPFSLGFRLAAVERMGEGVVLSFGPAPGPARSQG